MSRHKKTKHIYYAGELYLFIVLYLWVNLKTGTILVTLPNLAEYANLSIKTLFEYLWKLVQWNYVEVESVDPDALRIKLLHFTIPKNQTTNP